MTKLIKSMALLTFLHATAYAAGTEGAIPNSNTQNPKPSTETGAAATPTAPPVINCKYHISPDTVTISPSVLSTWAEKAAVQSFDFTPATLDAQLAELKPCYTDQGWQSFNDALTKSGNIDAIKSQHLTVSSQMEGQLQVTSVKDNQWKITIPLHVVYQNEKEKLSQKLSVDLLIGRKISGDLGIMQMIASPKEVKEAKPAGEAPSPKAMEDKIPSGEPKLTNQKPE